MIQENNDNPQGQPMPKIQIGQLASSSPITDGNAPFAQMEFLTHLLTHHINRQFSQLANNNSEEISFLVDEAKEETIKALSQVENMLESIFRTTLDLDLSGYTDGLAKLLERFHKLPWPPEANATERVDSADPFTIIANKLQLFQMCLAQQIEAIAGQYDGSIKDCLLTACQRISEVFDNAAGDLDMYSAMGRDAWLSNQFYRNPTTADSTVESVESTEPTEQLANAS